MSQDHTECKLSVLFVENEADIRHVVEIALARNPDFKLQSFYSGEEAIEHVRSASVTYDVVLLNVILPDIDGVSLMSLLRTERATAGATTLFITAHIPPGGVDAYREMGAYDVILKPFDVLKLAEVIRSSRHASTNSASIFQHRDGKRENFLS